MVWRWLGHRLSESSQVCLHKRKANVKNKSSLTSWGSGSDWAILHKRKHAKDSCTDENRPWGKASTGASENYKSSAKLTAGDSKTQHRPKVSSLHTLCFPNQLSTRWVDQEGGTEVEPSSATQGEVNTNKNTHDREETTKEPWHCEVVCTCVFVDKYIHKICMYVSVELSSLFSFI